MTPRVSPATDAADALYRRRVKALELDSMPRSLFDIDGDVERWEHAAFVAWLWSRIRARGGVR